jgi:hypothetical protein
MYSPQVLIKSGYLSLETCFFAFRAKYQKGNTTVILYCPFIPTLLQSVFNIQGARVSEGDMTPWLMTSRTVG